MKERKKKAYYHRWQFVLIMYTHISCCQGLYIYRFLSFFLAASTIIIKLLYNHIKKRERERSIIMTIYKTSVMRNSYISNIQTPGTGARRTRLFVSLCALLWWRCSEDCSSTASAQDKRIPKTFLKKKKKKKEKHIGTTSDSSGLEAETCAPVCDVHPRRPRRRAPKKNPISSRLRPIAVVEYNFFFAPAFVSSSSSRYIEWTSPTIEA